MRKKRKAAIHSARDPAFFYLCHACDACDWTDFVYTVACDNERAAIIAARTRWAGGSGGRLGQVQPLYSRYRLRGRNNQDVGPPPHEVGDPTYYPAIPSQHIHETLSMHFAYSYHL